MTPLAKAASSESRLKLLRELRGRLVDAVDRAECVRDVEPLCRRLAAVAAEIEELAEREKSGGPLDVVMARREARLRGGGVVPPVREEGRAHS
ncbi:hypothetical protein [Mycobacterium sp. E3298]|uniref:hypothetical protein n=1 Tax=Mycobacterium sp. E3298 TaxID=1856865 RepID=UPI0012E9D7E3|nr:hypothetical protein [Mycobacterium sp. E3298]